MRHPPAFLPRLLAAVVFLLAVPVMAGFSDDDVPPPPPPPPVTAVDFYPHSAAEIREALAEVRTAKDTHSKAVATAGLLVVLIYFGVQAMKRVRPLSDKWRRALPWLVAAFGALGGILSAFAGGLPWIDALIVGLTGPAAIALRDMVAGVVGWESPPVEGPRVQINDGVQPPLQLPRQRQRPMSDGLPPAAGVLLALSLAIPAISGCATLKNGSFDPLSAWRTRIEQKVSIYTDCSLPVLVDAMGDTVAYAAEEVISKGAAWLVVKIVSAGAIEPIQWLAIGKDLFAWIVDRWTGEWKPEIAACVAARAQQVVTELQQPGLRIQAGEANPLVGVSWLLDHTSAWASPPLKE